MWKDQFHYTIDAASDIIVAYAQPDLNISKAEQIAVLEEFGKVISSVLYKVYKCPHINCQWCWLLQVPTEVVNRVQSLLLNYLTALLRSGDFTLGELEYIRSDGGIW